MQPFRYSYIWGYFCRSEPVQKIQRIVHVINVINIGKSWQHSRWHFGGCVLWKQQEAGRRMVGMRDFSGKRVKGHRKSWWANRLWINLKGDGIRMGSGLLNFREIKLQKREREDGDTRGFPGIRSVGWTGTECRFSLALRKARGWWNRLYSHHRRRKPFRLSDRVSSISECTTLSVWLFHITTSIRYLPQPRDTDAKYYSSNLCWS